MTRQEKMILLVVALLVLTHVGGLAREVAVAYYYGTAPIPPADRELLKFVSFVLGSLVNVGAAIWLFVEARAAALTSWAWVLFGLFFGVPGVALFYLIQLYTRYRVQAS
jgi:hypothetical protein